MKILNVVSVYFSIPFFFGDQIGHFTAKGYDVHLICSPSDKIELFAEMHIPVDTRSAFPVISVQSPVSIQYRWQS